MIIFSLTVAASDVGSDNSIRVFIMVVCNLFLRSFL